MLASKMTPRSRAKKVGHLCDRLSFGLILLLLQVYSYTAVVSLSLGFLVVTHVYSIVDRLENEGDEVFCRHECCAYWVRGCLIGIGTTSTTLLNVMFGWRHKV